MELFFCTKNSNDNAQLRSLVINIHLTIALLVFLILQIRYLDDHIVSYKGEKSITVHRAADDYDGGSKGKVMTKGKRGPGFIMC